jgi:hypothetical protein
MQSVSRSVVLVTLAASVLFAVRSEAQVEH